MADPLNIKEELKGDILVLRMKGHLNAVTSPGVEVKIFESINKGQQKILIDFSSVDLLSSAGMRMLLSVNKKLKCLGGKLILCSVNPSVMDVFVMSGFNHVLEYVKTEDDGLRQF